MKKVLFMIPTLGHGGAEKVLVNLVNYMDYNEFQITVMTLYDEGVNKQFLSDHVRYKSCFRKAIPGSGHLLKIFSPTFLYNHLIKEDYEVVISYLEGQTARIISGCRNQHVKKYCWVHRTYTNLGDIARMFRNKRETMRCYSEFDNVVFVSEDVRKYFNRYIPLKNRSIVLYNTNDSEKILKEAKQPVSGNIFSKKEIKLVGMGSLISVKGFERLISIHAKLINEKYSVHTYILGEGKEREKLVAQIKELEVADTVTLLGYQENPYKYLNECDLFVCSSYSEGFSTAVTEALILGLPIVTTKVSGMVELLGRNNEFGIITENNEDSLYEGIRKLISNPGLLNEYRIKAKLRGKKFLTSQTVNAVENLLTED